MNNNNDNDNNNYNNNNNWGALGTKSQPYNFDLLIINVWKQKRALRFKELPTSPKLLFLINVKNLF